ncbi:hypothetical protein [Streptomyces sp. NPDC056308]|uniref:hypothetical protein n=1 Tax=Streptomyces sp. NPDC056308 TaxID=3345780 RepID=UPI0035D86F80
MNPQTHLAIDGCVDAIPASGTGWGTARFDPLHSPADTDRVAPDDPDTVHACTTGDPRIADVLLREIQPGDLLQVTGTAAQLDAGRPGPVHRRRPGGPRGRIAPHRHRPVDRTSADA